MKSFEELKVNFAKKVEGNLKKSESDVKEKETVIVTTFLFSLLSIVIL